MKKGGFFFVLLLVFVLFFLSSSVVATNYYVNATTGSDSNNGTTPLWAWKTISKVNSASFSAGDNIYFERGDTWRETLTIPSAGNSTANITFASYGTGTDPVINGANSTSGSWTQNITGAINQTNMKISLINGTAFVDFGSGNLGSYLGSQIVIRDSAGHNLTGYIKSVGTGETYGSELLPNTDFANISSLYNWTALIESVQSGGQSGPYLQINYTVGWGGASEGGTTTNGSLLLGSVYFKKTFGGTYGEYFTLGQNSGAYNIYKTSSVSAPSSWTKYSVYGTADMATVDVGMNAEFGSAGSSAGFDTASIKQVLTPSVTGVNITSTSNGTVYNWTSMDPGFNVNDPSGYTYIINSTSIANIYNFPLAIQPNQVFLNGVRTIPGSSVQSLTQNQWYYSTGMLSFYESGGNPDSIGDVLTASIRDYNINENGKSYVTIKNLSLQGANQNGLHFGGTANMILIDGINSSYAFQSGLQTVTLNNISNATIQNSVFSWNGGTGIAVSKDSYRWVIQGNFVHHNSQIQYGAGHYWSGGIYIWCDDNSIVNMIIQNNSVYSNAIASDGSLIDNSSNGYYGGNGIWLDTIRSPTNSTNDSSIVRYNTVYGNGHTGIYLEHAGYQQVYYNLVYNTLGNGIEIGDVSHVGGGVYSNFVYGNTVYNSTNADIQAAGANPEVAASCVNNTIKNNIAVVGTGLKLDVIQGCENDGVNGSGNVYLYNSFGAPTGNYNFIRWGMGNSAYKLTYADWEVAYCGSIGCSHSVQSDPLFNNVSNLNFTLQSTSPAIDAGVNVSLTRDFLGNTVPSGKFTDLGAFEYQFTGPMTYYVNATTGSDANNGLSPGTAWQTIAKVNSWAFSPGDQVLFEKGDTWRETLTLPSSGNSTNQVTFGAYGSGANPIISGSDSILGGWNQNATGSVAQQNMRISFVNGTAFLDFSSPGSLTNYLGDQVVITDSGGHKLTGYIKAAGTGETYGNELLPNTGFANISFVYNNSGLIESVPSGGQSGPYLRINYTSGWADMYEGLYSYNGSLLLGSVYMKTGAGGASQYMGLERYASPYGTYRNTPLANPGSWTQYSVYATTDMSSVALQMSTQFWNGATSLFDTASVKQVLTPSVTGVTITSTANGLTYSWASLDPGFNMNDPGNYTYGINNPAWTQNGTNVWNTTLTTQPNVVYFDGNLGTAVNYGSINSANQWNWSSNTLYVYSTSNPSTAFTNPGIEAGQRTYVLNSNSKNYTTFSSIDFKNANSANVYLSWQPNTIVINNSNISGSYDTGVVINGASTAFTINSSVIQNSGLYGIVHNQANNVNQYIVNNIIKNNGWRQSNTSGWNGLIQSGEISNNTVVNNGIGSTLGYGHGLYQDTGQAGSTLKIHDNTIYGNTKGAGILAKSSAEIYKNRIYSDGDAGISAGQNGATAVSFSIHDNLVYGNVGGIIYKSKGAGNFDTATYNNVMYQNGNGADFGVTSDLTSLNFKNNIIYSGISANSNIASQSGTVNIDYNNYYKTGETPALTYNSGSKTWSQWQALGYDAHGINSDPLFTNAAGNDFTLQSTSPAINAGANVGLTSDFLGNKVPVGQGFDMGAYEYQSSGGVNYYVSSTTGNDSADGLSPGTAWQTIAKVNSASFNPGDAVYLKKGDTWREKLTVPSSGNSTAPITFGAYGTGEQPILNGADLVTSWTQQLGNQASYNFSDNNISGWDLISGNISAANGQLEVVLGPAAGSDYIRENYTTRTEYWASFRFKFVNITWPASGDKQMQGGGIGYNNAHRITLGVANSSNQIFYMYQYSDNGGTPLVISNVQASSDTWHYVSLHWKSATGPGANNGIVQAWVDGSVIVNLTNVSSDTLTADSLKLGSTYSHVTGGGYVYVDDADIGTTPTGSNLWGAPVSGTVYQTFLDNTRAMNTDVGNLSTGNSSYWYSNGSYLYLHSTINPSTAYANPGVEASVRDGIYVYQKNYTLIDGIKTTKARYGMKVYGWNVPIINITAQNSVFSYSYYNGWDSSNNFATNSNLSVVNCTADHNGESGFSTAAGTDGAVIKNSTAYYNGNLVDSGTGFRNFQGSNVTFESDVSYRNGYQDDNLTYGSATGGGGFHQDTVGAGCAIRYSMAFQNKDSGIIVEKTTYPVKVIGNILYDNDNAGIELTATAGGENSNHIVLNNVAYGNLIGFVSEGNSVAVANNVRNNSVMNNVFFNNTLRQLSAINGAENDGTYGSGNVYLYNSFGPESSNFVEWGKGVYKSTYSAFDSAYGSSGHSVSGNPLFTNVSNGDFTLQSSSPAIDAGINLGTPYNLALASGSSWPNNVSLLDQNNYGSGWEIGAYAYIDTTSPTITLPVYTNNAQYSNTQNLTFNISVIDDSRGSYCSVNVNGNANQTVAVSSDWCNGTYSLTGINDGSKIIYAYANDTSGNTGLNNFYSALINTPGTTTQSTQNNLQGNTFASAWRTNMVTDPVFEQGYTTEMQENYRIQVHVGSENHYIGIVSITGGKATIQISSNAVNVTLSPGQNASVDVNDDSFYDVYVFLNSITGNQANLTIQKIHVPVTTVGNVVQTNGETQEQPATTEKKSLSFFWILALVIIIATIIFFGIKAFKRIKYYS